jgi:hypothetical protein
LPFEVFAYRTRSGEVSRKIPAASTPQWERGLNLMGSWSVEVALDSAYLTKEELTGVIDPWDWSWAICQGQKIWQAGPVLGERYSRGQSTTTIYGVGIWQLLADQRVSLNPTRTTASDIVSPDADTPFGPGALSTLGTPIPALNQALNLRGIAKRLVGLLLTEPGGDLPIDLPTDGSFTGDNVRDFPSYDTATWGERLFDLTQVVDGPEVEFIPRFTTLDREFIRHQMVLGSPRLGQLTTPHTWRSAQALQGLDYTFDGAKKARRIWERGSGMDRNVRSGFAQDLDGVTTGALAGLLPLLERVESSHNSTEDITTLASYASVNLATHKRGLLTLQPTVAISGSDGMGGKSGSPELSGVAPGDIGILQIRKHPRLPDGDYLVRIARMRGAGADSATLDTSMV